LGKITSGKEFPEKAASGKSSLQKNRFRKSSFRKKQAPEKIKFPEEYSE